MRFRVMLIIALGLTSLILFTNAKQMFFFEKAHAPRAQIAVSDPQLKAYAQTTLLGPNRYSEAIALSVASTRATSILDAALPEDSCVAAYETENGSFARMPFISIATDQKLTPASTNKLITAAVVLSNLDPETTLDTTLLASKKGSTISKAYVETSGDPSFVTNNVPPSRRPDYFSPTHVRTFSDFAANTYAEGVRSINSLVIDNTWFDIDSVEPGWSDDKAQVGQLAALNSDEGFEGNALAGNANDHAAAVLESAFESKGISIGSISFGAIPDEIGENAVIAKTSSASLEDLIADTLKTSNNVFAEQLLAAAVHEKKGKVTKQTRADYVDESLDALKIDRSGFVFVNGSGYSTQARATCEMESAVVRKMNALGIDLAELSSFAGKDGTLTKRFSNLDEDLRAKTGTLDGVTSLTGSLGNNTHFSFIANGSFSEEGGKALQEQVVLTLSQFPLVKSPAFPPFTSH